MCEMFVRATIMYFVIVALLKVVVKRQTGGVGRIVILVIVLIAESAGPGFTADYVSVVEGAVLVATMLFWSYSIEWLSNRFPRFNPFFSAAAAAVDREWPDAAAQHARRADYQERADDPSLRKRDRRYR